MIFLFESSILSIRFVFPVFTCCQRNAFHAQHFNKYSTSISKDIGYQLAFTCSKLTVEIVEKRVNMFQLIIKIPVQRQQVINW